MLTSQETRIVLFVLALLLFGTVVKHLRSKASLEKHDGKPMLEEVQFKRHRPALFPD